MCGKRTLFLLLFALVIFTTLIYVMIMSDDKCNPNSITFSICESLKLTYKNIQSASSRLIKTSFKVRTRITVPLLEPTQALNAYEVSAKLKAKSATTKPATKIPTSKKPTTKKSTKKKPITKKPTTKKLATKISSTRKPTTKKTITKKPTTKKLRPTKPTMEWLDVSEGKIDSDYGDNTCRDNPYRHRLVEILKRWIVIASKHNIKYFLTCGSLLGAWRNGDIVPWDTDMDVIIDSADNIKLDAIKDKRGFDSDDGAFHLILQEDWRLPFDKRRRFMCSGELVPSYSDECSFQEPLGRIIKDNHHLDIFDYKIKNGKLLDPSEWMKEYSIKDVFPLKKCKFMGLEMVCPRRPKSILFEFYGKKLAPNKICKNSEWIESN